MTTITLMQIQCHRLALANSAESRLRQSIHPIDLATTSECVTPREAGVQ